MKEIGEWEVNIDAGTYAHTGAPQLDKMSQTLEHINGSSSDGSKSTMFDSEINYYFDLSAQPPMPLEVA